MSSLEEDLNETLQLDVAPVIDQIKNEGGGLEGLSRIIEEVVMPLVGAQKAAILRLAREVDELRSQIAEKPSGE